MRQQQPTTWLDDALDNPRGAYSLPAEVLRDERLDPNGMRAILNAWERAERRGNFAGAETPELRDIWSALAELDRRDGIVTGL